MKCDGECVRRDETLCRADGQRLGGHGWVTSKEELRRAERKYARDARNVMLVRPLTYIGASACRS